MSGTEELDLHLINLKDDEATSAGTKAVRYLVQRLHKAHDNPSLSTMVRALLKDQMKMAMVDEVMEVATTSKIPQGGDQGNKFGERGKALQQEPSPKRRSPHPDDRSPKR